MKDRKVIALGGLFHKTLATEYVWSRSTQGQCRIVIEIILPSGASDSAVADLTAEELQTHIDNLLDVQQAMMRNSRLRARDK